MTVQTMTKEQKKAAIDLAWATYRAASQAIPRNVPFGACKRNGKWEPGVVERDEALFRQYLAAERSIQSASESRAA